MTDLKVFRRTDDGRDVEVRGATVALEVELQRRVEASMEAMLGIRFVASEYPTGRWHRGRIDSLGLDETGTPVVIEYKKGSDHGVMSQAVSYLSWLRSARHEFEALVKERLGDEAAETIDWRNPRMVCIASDFSHHDRIAVHDLHKRIDLVRYRVFDGGLLSLLLIESAPGSTRPAATARKPQKLEVPTDATADASDQPDVVEVPASLQDLYDELDEALTAWGEVEVDAKQTYIAYRRMVNLASVLFRPTLGVILLYLKVDPTKVVLEKGFTRDVREVGHNGTGDLEVRIASAADLEKAGPLIRRAFEAA
ncbi:DUF5655 domain-containing protein [Streptomyces acidiscabies]|uniref:DUF5655 domain-containing protein n=1 Tax=Streptomyces acidiscabies TaxID=42234 RepID=A0A0L0KJA0_9ACTN|nr:DUF5655 domain-containing protein [Streptomyces acidiscabies]KND38342.1 hypothetical protein IQ63_08275 [Streptomyces acidiscabies]